jgi:hypothetical protein
MAGASRFFGILGHPAGAAARRPSERRHPVDSRPSSAWWALAAATLLIAPHLAMATEDAELANDDRIAELERKVEILSDELERTRTAMAVPEEPALESVYGLGPAASKVYGLARGLSLGGYAEGRYTAYVADKGDENNEIDFLRFVLYAGYKFTDRILFNSEVEIEHASTGEDGSVSLEFATLDFLLADWANVRLGLLLLPMGFVNEIHEPPFYFGTHRPSVERRIIPSTWRENGAGLFGSLLGDQLEYKLYVVNGFDASGFSASGLRGGRQKGSKALAEDFAFVGRLDWRPVQGLLLGTSGYVGNAGQDQVDSESELALPDALTSIWEARAQYRRGGLHLRGLFTWATVNQADRLNAALENDVDAAIAEEMLGAYGEIAYDIWQWISPDSEMTLEPFYRYEWVDTQQAVPDGYVRNQALRNQIHTVGMSYKPIPNVVLKADYRNVSAEEGSPADEINLGIGLVF